MPACDRRVHVSWACLVGVQQLSDPVSVSVTHQNYNNAKAERTFNLVGENINLKNYLTGITEVSR